jgi:hypothetical protein
MCNGDCGECEYYNEELHACELEEAEERRNSDVERSY